MYPFRRWRYCRRCYCFKHIHDVNESEESMEKTETKISVPRHTSTRATGVFGAVFPAQTHIKLFYDSHTLATATEFIENVFTYIIILMMFHQCCKLFTHGQHDITIFFFKHLSHAIIIIHQIHLRCDSF